MNFYEKRLLRFIVLFSIVLSILYVCPVSCSWDQTITEIDVTYEVSPDGKNIHVLRQISFENKDEDTKFWRGYYSNFNYYLPANAKNICAYEKEKGNRLSWKFMPDGYYCFNLDKKVWYGNKYVFFIEYDLPCNINTAVFNIVEYGNRTTVIVRTPQSFETDIERKDYQMLEKGEYNEFVFPKGANWQNPCQVICVNHTEMREIKSIANLSEKDVQVTVRFWKGEDAWGTRILNTTIQSLLLLEDVTGIPYPVSYNITVIQASIKDTQGYGGFNQGSKGIYLLHTSSDAILIHELAHYWTRECHYSHIWLDEGHADLYTYLVLKKTKPEIAEKRKNRTLKTYEELERKYDLNLSLWKSAESFDSNNAEAIQFGYSKAFTAVFLVYEDLGLETMKTSWQRLHELDRIVDEDCFISIIEETSGKNIEYMKGYL